MPRPIIIPPAPELKWCAPCKDFLPRDQFGRNARLRDGLHRYCRTHMSAAKAKHQQAEHLRRAYDMTTDDYEATHAAQGGLCAICGRAETGTHRGQPRRLVVDHCHVSGQVCRLLCRGCNAGIGCLRDDPRVMTAAIEYLSQRAGGQ